MYNIWYKIWATCLWVMGLILRSRPVSSDDRLLPALRSRDLTVCWVELPFTPRCKQELLMAEVFLKMGASHSTAEMCGGLKWNGATGLNIPPRPAAVCSSHPGMPAHTLRCGLELSQEHNEERLDERDWVYSANHRPTVCLLPCLPAVNYTTYTAAAAGVCDFCVCVVCLERGDSQDPFITQRKYRLK